FVAIKLIQPPDVADIVPIATVWIEMVGFAALDDGLRLHLTQSDIRSTALGADRAITGIVAGAVEEHADAQGDGLAASEFFLFLLLFFQTVRGVVTCLLIQDQGLAGARSLRSWRVS